jgi:DNA-binding transcriptional regulator/RsmH inhibitor MraZ
MSYIHKLIQFIGMAECLEIWQKDQQALTGNFQTGDPGQSPVL